MANTSINMNQMKAFVLEQFGAVKINKAVAQEKGISNEEFENAQTDQDETTLTITEALEDEDIFANFASMCAEEEDKVKAENDKEKEKNRPVENNKNKAKS